jgi:glycosyltransferase involved in cell wall biosynthesis
MNNKLSYAFLAFNEWDLLERTLNSALKLQHSQGDIQWVVVDNSIPEYQSMMRRNIMNWMSDNIVNGDTAFFQNEDNRGEGGGMNDCFRNCDGKYILFFQDDWELAVDYNFIDLGIGILEKFKHINSVQLSKRAWSSTNPNVKMGKVLLNKNGITAFEMEDNGFGNHTNQIKLFKKSFYERIGPYLELNNIPWHRYSPDAREGSIVEHDYGQRLKLSGTVAAKINDGQFVHTLAENARNAHFITHGKKV